MTNPANDRYAKYRTRAEIAHDEAMERHVNGECEGVPNCLICLEAWEDANREELDSMGYYIGDKWVR